MTDVSRGYLLVTSSGFALALLLRLPGLWTREVWYDEALTQYAVWLDWVLLIKDRIAAGHSPLYFMLIKASGVPATDLVLMRTISAVADALACATFGFIAFRHVGPRAALFVIMLYALQPMLIVWAQNARPYGLMMFSLSIGLAGAMEVIARATRGVAIRGSGWPMAFGLSLAAVTLTAGTIAVGLIALSPLASRNLRNDRAFGRQWLRLLLVPAVAVTTMLAIVAVPHVIEVAGDFWTNKAAPFTWQTLGILGRTFVTGEPIALGVAAGRIGPGAVFWASIMAGVLLLLALLRGAVYLNRRAEFLPVIALALFYPALFVVISAGTSLLIPRYFLPAMGAVTLLAGIGFAVMAQRWTGMLAALLFLAIAAPAAVNQTFAPGLSIRPALRDFAALLLDNAPGRTRVLTVWDQYFGMDMRTLILLETIRRGGDPVVRTIRADTAAASLKVDGQVYLVLPQKTWVKDYAPILPAPDCIWQRQDAVMALWNREGTGCAALSE